MKRFEEVINEEVFQTNNCPSGWGICYTVTVWRAKKPTGVRWKQRTETRVYGMSFGNARARGLID